MHGKVVTTRLERVRTVSQRTLVVGQVGSAFSNLLCILLGTLAWMSNGLLSEQRSSEDGSELHYGKSWSLWTK